jgi:two-component system cell cycle sensor histidine kinase/response regulator CckA
MHSRSELGTEPPGLARRLLTGRGWPLRGYFALLVAIFLLAGGAAAGYVQIQSGRDARLAASHAAQTELAIILVGLAAILAASLLVYRRVARPIERLSAAVRSGGADVTETARAVAAVSGPAEVTALAEDIGGLMASIEDELARRRRAETRTSELAAIVAFSDDAILGKTLDGTITSWNVGAERMYGYAEVEAVGRSISILRPPDHVDELTGILERIAAGESVHRFETVRRRKDGTLVDVSLTISPIEDATGAIVGASTIARDISERKRAEEALRNSEAQYRLLFEGNPNPMWVFDVETLAFLAVNAAAINAYGYTRDEFLAMTIEEIRPPDEIPRLRETVAQSERGGEDGGLNVAGMWRHRRKDGTILEVEVTSHPLQFEGRRARVALAIDVTQRRHAERDARESAVRYEELVENASDLIATVDLESRLTSVNSAFEVAVGMSREELIGRPISELVPPEFHSELADAYRRKLGGEAADTVYEHELIAADGRRIAVEVASRTLVKDGLATGIQAICRDVSERKRLEGQLRQAQKMEAVGQLAGGIAHDFNNILAAISMYGDLALRSQDPEHVHAIVRETLDAVTKGASLTRQLLAFSRQQVLQPKVVDLTEALASLDTLLRRVLGEDIAFETSVEDQLGHVLVDPGQIEQVLMNLAVNARDAMPGGGNLRIEAANIIVDDAYAAIRIGVEPGPHVRISVTDTGEGMDAETREHLFDPFFTTKQEGTGLGLTTVYGIVKQSGGHISVYSDRGAGATFRLLFPIVEDPVDAPARERTIETGDLTGTETILVVEDEQRVRELIDRVLAGYGYTILTAGTPDEALQIASTWSEPIHLILSDVMLPGETGPQLVEKLQALHPEAKCVFSSGYAHGHVGDRGLPPDQPFIAKPYSAVELASTIRQTLDQ